MITVFGRNTSVNVQAVMWCIAELGLENERLDFGGAFGKTDTPEYRAMNPHGLVPTIKDGDTVVWESAAIIRYLACKYGDERFWPRDPGERAAARHVGGMDALDHLSGFHLGALHPTGADC
jgi:glutathione S-transferase